jgi:muramoyltetrapeptide carboxypeptidase
MPQSKNIIDIASIATPCTLEENDLIKKILIKNNFEVNFFNENKVSINQPQNHHFASIEPYQRFLNFKEACENINSKIIWCNRGGYGSADILPYLYQMPKPKNKKILIGFSDIVSIASFVQKNWGWKVVCAPMLSQILKDKVSVQSQQIIFDLINGKIAELNYDLKLLKGAPSQVESEIVGGCVSVLAGNYATKNQLDWRNKILFLEDEGEDGERLERYFTQIAFMLNEKKSQPQAILLGNFLEGNEFGNPQSQKINLAIQKFCDKINNITIWQETSNSLGHSFNQKPLILGIKSKILTNGKISQKINLSFFSKKLKMK